MDNEGLLTFIKTVTQKAVNSGKKIFEEDDKNLWDKGIWDEDGNTMWNLVNTYHSTLLAIWQEIEHWKPIQQKQHGMEQAFGLINNEYPIGLRGFYSAMIKEGWPPPEALMFTRELLIHLLGIGK